VPDSDLTISITWAPSNTDTGTVVWGVDYKVVKSGNDELIDSTGISTVTDSKVGEGTANEQLDQVEPTR